MTALLHKPCPIRQSTYDLRRLSLALLDPALPEHLTKRSPLAVDWRRFNHTVEAS